MKRFLIPSLFLLCAMIMFNSCSSDAWDELPSPIANFISEYYPGSGVKSYQASDNDYRVQVANGASIVFNSRYEWTEVDGNGATLPQVMMYDLLPPALYEYLQGIEQQSQVYGMTRDKYYYKLTMHDTVITYEISTGRISYPGQALKAAYVR